MLSGDGMDDECFSWSLLSYEFDETLLFFDKHRLP